MNRRDRRAAEQAARAEQSVDAAAQVSLTERATVPATPDAIRPSEDETDGQQDAVSNHDGQNGFTRCRVTHGSLHHDGTVYPEGSILTLPVTVAEAVRDAGTVAIEN